MRTARLTPIRTRRPLGGSAFGHIKMPEPATASRGNSGSGCGLGGGGSGNLRDVTCRVRDEERPGPSRPLSPTRPAGATPHRAELVGPPPPGTARASPQKKARSLRRLEILSVVSVGKRLESPLRPADILWALLPLVFVRIAALLNWRGPVFGLAVTVFVLGWMIVFPWWSWRRRGGRSAPATVSVGGVIRELLLAPLFLLLVSLVLGVVAVVTETVSGQTSEAPGIWREAATASEGWRLVVIAVHACILGPVAEEVFFRWFLFQGLRKWWGGLGAALAQAALFALSHPYGVKGLVLIFVHGLLFQKIYLWRRTLLAPVFVHAFFNVVVLVSTFHVASQPRPYLGIRGDGDAPNCVIKAVVPGSAAAEAGLREDDVITSLDGQPVTSFRDLVELLRHKEVGDRVRIGILRPRSALPGEPFVPAPAGYRNNQALTVEAVLGSTKAR